MKRFILIFGSLLLPSTVVASSELPVTVDSSSAEEVVIDDFTTFGDDKADHEALACHKPLPLPGGGVGGGGMGMEPFPTKWCGNETSATFCYANQTCCFPGGVASCCTSIH